MVFKVQQGIRYSCGVLAVKTVVSRVKCAFECASHGSCASFNFDASGQCELLSATAYCITPSSGLGHWYQPAGKHTGLKIDTFTIKVIK